MTVREKQSHFKAEYLLSEGVPEKFVEIVHGELIVCEPAGRYHNRIADNFLILFRRFCETRPGLDCSGDNDGFLLWRDPDTLYSPDAALYRRRPDQPDDQPWQEFCPELLVEVASKSNTPKNLQRKCRDYFRAGAEQVWIVNPQTKTAAIIFNDGRRMTFNVSDVIHGEGIANGLVISVGPMFEM